MAPGCTLLNIACRVAVSSPDVSLRAGWTYPKAMPATKEIIEIIATIPSAGLLIAVLRGPRTTGRESGDTTMPPAGPRGSLRGAASSVCGLLCKLVSQSMNA